MTVHNSRVLVPAFLLLSIGFISECKGGATTRPGGAPPEGSDQAQKRIAGGRPSKRYEFPYIIAIQKTYQPARDASCGASLISPSVVLTAAHCLYDPEQVVGSEIKFTLLLAGGHDFAVKSGEEQVRKIAILAVHEEYDWDTNVNDIALAKLDKPFDLQGPVETVRMAHAAGGYSKINCSIAGWGYLHPMQSGDDKMDEGGFPKVLQTVQVDIIEKELCTKNYKGQEEEASAHHSKTLCAGHLAGGKDACGGDSGGPLVCDEDKGASAGNGKRVLLVGIVSGGAGCAIKNLPGVYTDVAKYMTWIQDTASKKLKEKLDS